MLFHIKNKCIEQKIIIITFYGSFENKIEKDPADFFYNLNIICDNTLSKIDICYTDKYVRIGNLLNFNQ